VFGYVAFLYPFVLILPAFALYKESTLTERRIGVFLASMILLFSFLMAQSIIVKSELSGSFGRSIVAEPFAEFATIAAHVVSIPDEVVHARP
jgi:S-DNA-T family DNA segregation ATPase FtsK/SpoIIIE